MHRSVMSFLYDPLQCASFILMQLFAAAFSRENQAFPVKNFLMALKSVRTKL